MRCNSIEHFFRRIDERQRSDFQLSGEEFSLFLLSKIIVLRDVRACRGRAGAA